MVRVNYPPGGATKLHSETAREPKTVRILKPPGGESSISFTDDSSSRSSSRSSTQTDLRSPFASVQEQSFDSKPAEVHAEESVKDNTETSLQQNGSHGKTLKTQSSVDPDPSGDLVHEKDPVVAERSDEEAKASTHIESENPSNDNAENSSASEYNAEKEIVITESEVSSDCKLETSSAEISTEKVSVITSSTETHHSSEEEISSTHENSVHEVNGSVKAEMHEERESVQTRSSSNGVKSSNLLPLAMQHDDSAAYQPPSPSSNPSSPVKPNEDTRGRVFGQPSGNITPQPVQPRKIKDHMRSNIFMSDEDYTPTRSSRMNAATINDPKQEAPAAGQRQRIPPGGFSTKLW